MSEPLSVEAFNEFVERIMRAPTTTAKVMDLDGRIYDTDASKLAPIAPDKIKFAMSNPDLRKLIVTHL